MSSHHLNADTLFWTKIYDCISWSTIKDPQSCLTACVTMDEHFDQLTDPPDDHDDDVNDAVDWICIRFIHLVFCMMRNAFGFSWVPYVLGRVHDWLYRLWPTMPSATGVWQKAPWSTSLLPPSFVSFTCYSAPPSLLLLLFLGFPSPLLYFPQFFFSCS